MVADALVYHPTVTHYLKYVATTIGRDKFLRTLQYFSRFYAWYLYRTNHPQSSISPFETIKKQFGLTRKLMRLGKFIEHFKAAAQAADAKSMDPVLRFCAVGRQLGYAGYMLLDNMTVPDALGVRKTASIKTLQKEAYRMWFAGLTFNIVAGIYTLVKLRERSVVVEKGAEGDAEKVVEGKKLVRDGAVARLQLISDVCDVTIPSAALGFANLDDGFVGLAGTVSSLIGMYTVWKKTA